MKHEYSEMIKVKSDNMELIVFGKVHDDSNSSWVEVSFKELVEKHFCDYFVCLPQHKEACSHWLNGGDVSYPGENHSFDYYDYESKEDINWSVDNLFMEDVKPGINIKPTTVKRWIIYNLDEDRVEQVFNREASGFSDPSFNHSMHEIEVNLS